MAIRSIAKGEMPPDEYRFPMIMQRQGDKIIVFFWKFRAGVVIGPGCSATNIGYMSDVWNMDGFTVYTEPITLQTIRD